MKVTIVVKWVRIKRICEEMCGKSVHIHSSTDVSDDQIAGVEFTATEVNIILNMRRTKKESMILKAIAHEMTHVILGNREHGINFKEQWKTNEQFIVQEYNKN